MCTVIVKSLLLFLPHRSPALGFPILVWPVYLPSSSVLALDQVNE